MPDASPTIGHVLHRLYLAGAEVLAAELARKMRDRLRFVFLCLDEIGPLGEQLAGEGFEVIDLKRRPGVDWSVARRIRQAVKTHRIDLLHAHQYTPFFYAACSRGLRSRPRVIFTEHGRHWPDYRRPKRVIANRFLLRRHDRATAVGDFVRQALIDNEGICADRVQVIRNGIDPASFSGESADPAVRAQVRRDFGIGEDQPVVLQVARFHPVKDHQTAVRAFAHAAEIVPSARFLLVGDGDLRADAESSARELGVADQVVFAGVRQDIPRMMAAADVFMLSSVSEGISVTLLEAMAANLPIAATEVGGNPEVVLHGRTGLLSPRGDGQALGQNLAKLMSDAGLRRTMGKAGHTRLLEMFTQDRMHAAYEQLYQDMLGSPRP